MRTLAQLEKELKEASEDMSNDALYGAINHEALEEQDDFDHSEDCDCCYYAFSAGDTPEGDI